MGVRVVRRYIDILTILIFHTPLVLALFLAAASLLLCSFLKCFFRSFTIRLPEYLLYMLKISL